MKISFLPEKKQIFDQMNEIDVEKLKEEIQETIRSWYRNPEGTNRHIDYFTYKKHIPFDNIVTVYFILVILSKTEVSYAYLQNNPDLPLLPNEKVDEEKAMQIFKKVHIDEFPRIGLRFFANIHLEEGKKVQITCMDLLESFSVLFPNVDFMITVTVKSPKQFRLTKKIFVQSGNSQDLIFSEGCLPVRISSGQKVYLSSDKKCEISLRGIIFNCSVDEKSREEVNYETYGFRRNAF